MSGQSCPICGYQNPAGSVFCENCGRRLPDPVGARPPAGYPPVPPVSGPGAPQPPVSGPGAAPSPPPAPGAPPGFPGPPRQAAPAPGAVPPPSGQPAPAPQAFSPYYQPGGTPPPVSRTSPGLIVGITALALIALVVLSLAGFLVVRRLGPGPQAASPTPAPVATPRGGPVPAPTTGPTAPPTTGPTAPPTSSPGAGSGGGTVTTSTFSLDPGDFQVTRQTATEADLQGSVGDVAVAAGQPPSPTTTAGELSSIQQQLESQYGALQTCVDSQTFAIGGKSGTLEGWQYTDTDSSGNQIQVCDAYWVDVAPNGNLYEYEQLGNSQSWNSQLEPAAQPVRDSIKWLI